MKRVKTVYTSNEIPHLWANQTTSYARNQQGNFYFERDVIYSYGSHFPIARLVKKKGQTVVFITTRSYSAKTAQHIWAVRRAVSHLPIFPVLNPLDIKNVWAIMKTACADAWKRVLKTRQNKGYSLNQWEACRKAANEYAELFGLTSRINLPPDYSVQQAQVATYDLQREERQREVEARYLKRAAKEQEKFKELLPQWLDGTLQTNLLPRTNDIYLRLAQNGVEVETSWGARVPLESAIKFWRAVQLARKHQREYKGTGWTVGGFTVNYISVEGDAVIGCHDLKYAQLKLLADKLNLGEAEDDAKTN